MDKKDDKRNADSRDFNLVDHTSTEPVRMILKTSKGLCLTYFIFLF